MEKEIKKNPFYCCTRNSVMRKTIEKIKQNFVRRPGFDLPCR